MAEVHVRHVHHHLERLQEHVQAADAHHQRQAEESAHSRAEEAARKVAEEVQRDATRH